MGKKLSPKLENEELLKDIQLVLVDGPNILWRSWHAFNQFHDVSGVPTGLEYGTFQMLLRLRKLCPHATMEFAFDSRNSWRRKIYPEYKTHKKLDETRRDVYSREPTVVEQLNNCVGILKLDGFEADDLIATRALNKARSNLKVLIVSSDRDYYGLVSDYIYVFSYRKKVVVNREWLVEQEGVDPSRWYWWRAIEGDFSDGLPGVKYLPKKEVKEKIAAYQGTFFTFLTDHSSIRTKRGETIGNHLDQIALNFELSNLHHSKVKEKYYYQSKDQLHLLRDYFVRLGFMRFLRPENWMLIEEMSRVLSQA